MFSSETSSHISQNQDSCGILEAASSLFCCLWFELPGRVLDPGFFQPLQELTCKETKLFRLPSEILLVSSMYLQQPRLLAEEIFYPLEQVGLAMMMMMMMVCFHISLHSGDTLDLFLLHLIAQSQLVAQSQLLEYSQEKERSGGLRRRLCLLAIFL
jgi:hypothetical protein